jgi:hypothetical protein
MKFNSYSLKLHKKFSPVIFILMATLCCSVQVSNKLQIEINETRKRLKVTDFLLENVPSK